jgi:hypothetical protein
MEPNQQNPYEFITNPEHGRHFRGPNFGSKKRQIFIGIIFAVVVLTLSTVVGTLLLNSGDDKNENLINLEAYQTEIDRVITLGQKAVVDPQINQQLSTLKIVVSSDQKQLSELLLERNVKTTALQLSVQKDTKIDTALDNAAKIGNFDETLQQTIDSLAKEYYTALTNAKKDAVSKKEQDLITLAINNIESIFQVD